MEVDSPNRAKVTGLLLAVLLLLAFQPVSAQTSLPQPVLVYLGPEFIERNGQQYTRYKYTVENLVAYPADLFEASPTLPPCGTNTRASRTWVDFYTADGRRLNGFCALSRPQDLNGIWFALETNVIPPSWIYVEFTDRKTNTKYKSSLTETTQ